MKKRLQLLLALILAAASTWATTWTVGPTGNYTTIQAAINAASNGDIVLVNDGNYVENLSINGKNIALKSVNGRSVTTITGTAGLGQNATVSITGPTDGLRIGDIGKGFTIIGFDNGAPGIENAAVYFIGSSHTNAVIQGNEIQANGDEAFLCDYNANDTYFTIDNNIFSGQTFVGTNPAVGDQWTVPNVPRQLIAMGGGSSGTNTHHITFTNNTISGVSGGYTSGGQPSGNTCVTIDADNTVVTGNIFQGTTTAWQSTSIVSSLRCRRPGTIITGNTFSNTGLLAPPLSCHLVLNSAIPTNIYSTNTFNKGIFYTNGTVVGIAGIQNAISAAAVGSTIYLAQGSYTEQVLVNKENLTITGMGIGQTIIKSPAILTTSFGSKKAVVCAHTVNTATLSDLTIDGDGKGNSNYQFVGLAFWNAGGTVSDVDVIGIRDTPFSGAQHGVGVYAYNDTGGPYTITIDGMDVSDFQKNAFALSGTGLTVDLNNIGVTGAGSTTVTAQNGIQIGFGASGTVDNANVTGIDYVDIYPPIPDWTATAVLLYDGGTVDLNNVNITNSQTNVYFIDTDGSFTNGSVTTPVSNYWADGIDVYASGSKGTKGGMKINPSVFEENAGKAGSKGTVTVEVENSTFTGILNTDCIGISAVADGTINLTLTGNNVNNWDYGIYAYEYTGGVVNVTAHGNDLSGNNVAFYYGTESKGTMDASNNYWGTIVGSEIAALISGNVDYTPWCNEDYSICTYGAGGGPGPVTTIDEVTVECTNAVISVPVTVTGFNNVGAISLTMNFDNVNFSLDNVEFNPAISAATYFVAGDVIAISYFDIPGANLADGAILFTMEFTWVGASCPTGVDFDITFDCIPAINCEYASGVFDEDPYTNTAADFIAGNIAILRTTEPAEVGTPVSTSSSVQCGADAVPPTLPVVKDVCGVTLTAPTPVITGTYTTCEGTKIYTYTYEDCAGLEFVWFYTYTIDRVTAPDQVGGPVGTSGGTVECETAPTPPTTLPVVKDVCGTTLSPSWDSPVIDAANTISRVDDFSSGIALSATAAPGKWYVDRKAPAGFTTALFGGDYRLKQSINAADYNSGGYPTPNFYNTQGRKYNVGENSVSIKLYIPSDWATTNKRMAGFWGTSVAANYAVSGYPIIEFTSAGSNPRFRAYDDGTWIDMGLPSGFAYDTWVTLKITLLPSKEFKLEADDISYTTINLAGYNSVELNNVILEGYNYNPAANQGVTYDIYWDDFSAVMCEGSVDFVYRYLDCSYDFNTETGLQYTWTYSYTVDHSTAPVVPADGGSTVYDIANAIAPTLPAVTDVCGVVLTGVLASIVDNPNPFTYPGTRTFTYTFTDCAGLYSTWKYIYTVPGIAVSGVVSYYKTGNPVLNKIDVTYTQGSIVKTATTADVTGAYSISNLAPGTYSITFETDKAVGGINSTDAAQVNYWGVNQSSIEKVRWLSGDVTGNNSINGGDATRIQEYFLTQGNPLTPFITDWSFWKPGEMISANPGGSLGDPQVTITGSGPSATQNFYGLVTGDFNRSFTPGTDGKSGSESLTLNYGQTIETGAEAFELPLYAGMDMTVGAVSLILNIPSDELQVNNVYLGSDANTPVLYDVTGDELRISWYSSESLQLQAGQRLVTLVLQVIEPTAEPIYLSLATDPLNELADQNFEVFNAQLTVDIIKTTALGMGENPMQNSILFSNYPNPFVGTTSFVYTIPTDGKVLIEVYDIVGNRVMEAVNETQSAGEYLLKLDRNNLRPGVYTATLKLENNGSVISRTIKVISK